MPSVSRLGLSDRAGIQMVAADDDRRFQLALAHHLVEGEAQPRALRPSPPSRCGPGRPWNLMRCRRHVEPVVEMLVVGDQLLDLGVGLVDVLRPRRRAPPSGTGRRRGRRGGGYRPGRSRGNRRRWRGRLPWPSGGCCCRNRRSGMPIFWKSSMALDLDRHRLLRGLHDRGRVLLAHLGGFGEDQPAGR